MSIMVIKIPPQPIVHRFTMGDHSNNRGHYIEGIIKQCSGITCHFTTMYRIHSTNYFQSSTGIYIRLKANALQLVKEVPRAQLNYPQYLCLIRRRCFHFDQI